MAFYRPYLAGFRLRPRSASPLLAGLVVLPALAATAAPARAWDQWATEVIDFSSQYSTSRYSAAQTLDMPNVLTYGDRATAWTPASQNGTTEHITVGFPDPVYANGVTIRETNGNGFVTKVEVLDTNGAYHQVWSGTDTSQPGDIVEFKVAFAQTAYLVRGVRVTINTSHSTVWEQIDAIRLHGEPPGDYQWASRVVAASSEYYPSPQGYSAAMALGEPDVVDYGDDPNAWAPKLRDGGTEFLTLGFERPVFATGVLIRETNGNGFVRKIEALDTGGSYHEVWTGTDPSQVGLPAMFLITWPQTAYPVDGVRITIDTKNTPTWEEIDAVYIRGASAGIPVPTVTGISPDTSFHEAAGFSLTVNGTNFLGTSVVRWNGTDRPTQYVSPTQLKADIAAADVATPGTAAVTVFNIPPGGGVSNPVTFTISETLGQWASSVRAVTSEWGAGEGDYSAAQALGPPDVPDYGDDRNAWAMHARDVGIQSITLLFPRAVYANGAMIRETSGSGFVRKIEALGIDEAFREVWAGTDTSPTGQVAEFQVSFTQTSYPVHGLRITVDGNHAPGEFEEIDAVQLQGVPVSQPAPTIASLGPNPALRAAPAHLMVVHGTGFAPNSVVRWNGAERVTTYVSPTVLTAQVMPADVAANGSASITVHTPPPGGGTSAAATLTIGPARYGDVNNNDAVAVDDVVAALRTAAGINAASGLHGGDVAPEYPASAGGYSDGSIGVADALRIARFLQGL